MRHLLTSLFLLAATGIQAQHKTILTNTTVIDGTGRAPQSHVAVVISDGKIINITRGKLAVFPDDIQIDCTGKFIMPEIIDCHSHVGNLKGTTTSPDN
ncbi:MAG TPA: hypothetical protein VI233_11935, partial [Puia sp.]